MDQHPQVEKEIEEIFQKKGSGGVLAYRLQQMKWFQTFKSIDWLHFPSWYRQTYFETSSIKPLYHWFFGISFVGFLIQTYAPFARKETPARPYHKLPLDYFVPELKKIRPSEKKEGGHH